MAIRTLLKFRNLDLTKDINDRYTRLITPGIFDGGNVVPVTGQMKVEVVAPWKLISKDGLVIEETSNNTRLSVAAGLTTVIAVKVVYVENNLTIVEDISAKEISAFNLLSDKDYYIIFAYVVVPADATSMLSDYIQFSERDIIDKIGRHPLRGVITNVSLLPAAKDNIVGDQYIVADGMGGIPHIYGWSGLSWVILTDAATVTANLALHRGNNDSYLHNDEIHVTVDQKNALSGTSGTLPNALNPFVDNADARIPSQPENNALKGTDDDPSDSNRYITEGYPWAIPTEIAIPDTYHPSISSGAIAVKLNGSTAGLGYDGPIYIGHFGTSDVTQYFKFYDPTLNREYTTSISHPTNPNSVVNITGVYIDAACTHSVQPVDEHADLDGFCTIDLYLKWDIIPDTPFRILFAKKQIMKKVGDRTQWASTYHPFPDAFLRRRASDAQVPASVIKAIQDIKGRDFDDVPPISEQNTHLRGNVIGTKEYVGAVFKSDNVIGDFKSVEGIPTFANDFMTNVGIPQNYTFENTLLSSVIYAYDPTSNTGTITYGSPSVNLSSVVALRDVFIDGSLNEYKILTVDNILKKITISKRNGKIPKYDVVGNLLSVNTTIYFSGLFTSGSNVVTGITDTTGLVSSMLVKTAVGAGIIPDGTIISSVDSTTQITMSNVSSLSGIYAFVGIPNTVQSNYYIKGSIKKDNNPRKINLATLKCLYGRELVYCRQIKPVPNEFHPTTGNIAYEIFSPIKSATFREPRIRFYSGFKNREFGNRSRVVATGTGTILITGFFTHLYLIADLKDPTNTFVVKVDGDPAGTTITSANLSSGFVIADTYGFDTELDLQHQYLKLTSTALDDLVPHTVEITVVNATDDCIIYGFDFTRNATTMAMLPGRAFVQSDLYQRNILGSGIAAPQTAFSRCRGLVSTRYVNRQLVETTQTTTMYDLDGTLCPNANVNHNQTTFGSQSSKLAYYQVGDVVKLIITGADNVKPTYERVMVVSLVSSGTLTFTTPIDANGGLGRPANLLHVASTVGDVYDPVKEFNRYMFTNLGVKQSTDFAYLIQSGTTTDKVFTLEDGTTSVAANQVSYSNTSIEGADIALSLGASSILRIRAVATQLDVLVVNSTSVTGIVSIDGSPALPTTTFTGGGLAKITLWCNARYQSHEAVISSATGLKVVGFIVYEPTHGVKLEGSLLATTNIVASYDSSLTTDGQIVPTGAIAIDPYKFGGVFVNSSGTGSDWATSVSFEDNPYWGRYTMTTKVGAYFEYTFIGSSFEIEYLSLKSRKVAEIYVDNTLATQANFNGVTIKNIYQELPVLYSGGYYTAGQVDMYENTDTPTRRKFGMYGIANGSNGAIHTVKVLCTGINNPSGIGAGSGGITICTMYELNSNGYMGYSPCKGFRGKVGVDEYVTGLNWVRDERVFDSGFAVKEETPSLVQVNSQSVAMQDIRTDKILLTDGSTTQAVTFSLPYSDSDYFIDCHIITNAVTPTIITVVPNNITSTGFTANFGTIPTDSYNYYLTYTATKYL